ncbi:carbon monoxide dehydrogenase subunit G [Mumia sp. zg.B53]|uniref:SRPBCC family protein n=1 Tax=unclassified Mumia TaxID=2621872 RepID=UPI001C6E4E7E|nr:MULTISPECIES: carbon monoxide dehydrogenase subunit G [unclassified Mumia]MBW9210965.1 carbon monoxide dehydrogenase subunit G [Mumia sp. zg.B21]MBW9215530.1 carbon monoxide dehydrogenase subunit G [Mumia sp. zg.B53]
MKVAGEAVLNAPVAAVWEALLDPQVLVRTIPGCEVLEETGDNAYAMTVSAGVASIRGSYTGTCALSDLVPHESLVMRAQGAGAPGTVAADVAVRFADRGDGTTGVSYAADAVVGGMIGGVGQRMLTAVSKRMAGEFFGAVDDALSGAGAEPDGTAKPEATSSARTDDTSLPGQRFTAPAASTTRGRGRAGSNDDFVRGVVVGGVLVLAGVVAGGLFGRRSR